MMGSVRARITLYSLKSPSAREEKNQNKHSSVEDDDDDNDDHNDNERFRETRSPCTPHIFVHTYMSTCVINIYSFLTPESITYIYSLNKMWPLNFLKESMWCMLSMVWIDRKNRWTKFLVSRLTATGLPGTAPLFEKLRDGTCLHDERLSSLVLLLSLPRRSSFSSVLCPFLSSTSYSVSCPFLSSIHSPERTRRERERDWNALWVYLFLSCILFSSFLFFSSVRHPRYVASCSRACRTPFDHLTRRWKVCASVREVASS